MTCRIPPIPKPAIPASAPLLQRKPSCDGPVSPSNECAQCQAALAPQRPAKLQRRLRREPNRTGMPDHLKSGLEELSGLDLSAVRVHHDSSKPAQIQAHAFTFGNDIYLGPGQEHHLAHEGWHVVQQMQTRVVPTSRLGQLALNDDCRLEGEADAFGARAEALGRSSRNPGYGLSIAPLSGAVRDEPYESPIAFSAMDRPMASLASRPIVQGARIIQRAANFVAGTVTATTNMATHLLAGNMNAGFTPPTLNGHVIMSAAAARAAIVPPVLNGRCNVDGTDTVWVSSVGINTGSFTMQLPSAGPWSTVTPKANLNAFLVAAGAGAVPRCATAGNTTFSVHGRPTDAAFVANTTTHENLHATDHRNGFTTVIGAWDTRLQAARSANTRFTGASQAAAEAALYAAMGGTPASIADDQNTEWLRLNAITHTGTTPATGGPATASNLVINANCTSSSIDLS